MNFETVSAVLAVHTCANVCVCVSQRHGGRLNACVCVCLHLHERRPGSLPVLCIAELVQRLSFGLLIPFYSTGIMCYSNPNPIWGAWRWHEDDVTARTRGETENHRPTQSHNSPWEADYRWLHAWTIILKVFAHSRSSLSGGKTHKNYILRTERKINFNNGYYAF